MNKKTSIIALICTVSVWLGSLQPLSARAPNVVVILTDDQGWGDLSLNGNQNLDTPKIDTLAADGAMFDWFYVSPVCSPTRAEFLTGRYHPRGGIYSTGGGGERLDLDEVTIADSFKAGGYATGAFGKWHNGGQYPYHPNGRGFETFYGFCAGHWGDYYDPLLERNGELVQGEGFIVDDLTDKAIEFMREHKEQPFFCYIPYNTPHSPMQVPDRFYDKFAGTTPPMLTKRDELPHTLAALAMCENIDWNVGRVLQALEDMELSDDTIVVFFGDNGPNGWRWNGGLKGKKSSTDEGGIRSPLLVRWPGKIPAGLAVEQPAAAIDLLPTLTDLAGIPILESKPLDGVSLKPLLQASGKAWEDRLLFSHWGRQVSVRDARYRLDAKGKLYDLETDPSQSNDVSEAHPDVATRLSQAVAEWERTVLAELVRRPGPLPLGHPDTQFTLLPAGEGSAHGNIKRSNRWPNCSFFMNWTSLDDRITWNVEVPAAGTFEVTLYYTCREADVGAEIELSLLGESVSTIVTEAHDPPLRGAENDRSPREESEVKDFRPLKLGKMHLPEGTDKLTLRALQIPGEGVVDVAFLEFKRVE